MPQCPKKEAEDEVVPKVTMNEIRNPVISTSEKLICDLIEDHWKLADVFMYMMKLRPTETDEISDIYYFDAIFSQPTPKYPIPQASVKVTFKVRVQHLELKQLWKMVSITFRVEGFYSENDVRAIRLTADWLRLALKLKYRVFKRIAEFHF
ncbi:hypothetical protein EVAR_20645_1 [Eumeta japonica]|uniref:Uncharacterized protein n=1 Tax=Eumeta variegata TaxID=151549 RepID=A0A4C1VBA1_EUMVA|nr:hypothetical protein EVAR_20645_1 [Eumeta japonica]